MYSKQFKALGTSVDIRVPAESIQNHSEFDDISERVVESFLKFEAQFTRFDDGSELSHINSNPGKWMRISSEFAQVMSIAERAFRETKGIVNPCVGQIMNEIGYDQSFDVLAKTRRGEREVTSSPDLTVLIPNPDNIPFTLSSDGKELYLSPGFQLDLGGIVKGWIVEQAANEMRRCGVSDFVLSAGGDMVCSGSNSGSPWPIGLDNPHVLHDNLLTLDVLDSCVATSGIYRRRWQIGNETVHHIIDPRTGRSAKSDIVSCTVIARDLVDAEVFAKTCLILGSAEGIEWLNHREVHGWVIVKDDREVRHSWSS